MVPPTAFMKLIRLSGCFLAAILLSSCVTDPDSAYEKLGLQVPAAWAERASNKPVPDTNWVSSFRDSKLEKIIDDALEENKDLKRQIRILEEKLEQIRRIA